MPSPHTTTAPLLALIAGILLCGCGQTADEALYYEEDSAYQEMVGKPAPDFRFTSIANQEIDLARLRGSVVLLDFWATWTPPCMELIPAKKAAYKRYHHAGFEIVGISADFDRNELQSVVAREGIEWQQYFDSGGKDNAAIRKFGIRHFPSMWLLDKRGTIRYVSAAQDLETKIETLLRENAAAAGKAGWSDKLTSMFKSKKVDDTVSAMDELLATPEVYIDVTITRTRRIATVKSADGTHQVVTGKKLTVATDSGKVDVICKEIRTDAVIFVIPGQERIISVEF